MGIRGFKEQNYIHFCRGKIHSFHQVLNSQIQGNDDPLNYIMFKYQSTLIFFDSPLMHILGSVFYLIKDFILYHVRFTQTSNC